MRRWIVLLLSSLLAACAEVPLPPVVSPQLFADGAFTPPTEHISADDVFALSPEMRLFVRDQLSQRVRRDGRRGLLEALQDRQLLKLEYDATRTRNAAEAFEAHQGNCLSLVIMTAAFAKEMGLSVSYQSAVLDDTWSREGSLYFSVGHVNIALARRLGEMRTVYDNEDRLLVDFLPAAELQGLRTRTIPEQTVVAMFMNNRAAEALAGKRLDDAYWWAKEAIHQDASFLPAYNTLGVIYADRGLLPQASLAFESVLSRQPMNPQALSNEAGALHRLGRTTEAAALESRLNKIEPYPPFYFFDRGLTAMHRGDYAAARDMFSKEVDRAGYYHEFHFWLALADYQLGDLSAARSEMRLAMENSTRRTDHDLYAAKLARLDATRQGSRGSNGS